MSDPLIIDAHLHLWDRSRFDYPWLEDAGDALPFSFRIEQVDSPAGRPDRVVFVQADCVPEQGIAEAAWASDQVEQGGGGAVVAFAPLESTDLPRWLERLREIPRVTGIRRLLQDEPDDLLDSSASTEGLNALGRAGLAFDACIRYFQIPAVTRLVDRAPGTVVVLDHLGKPPIRSGWGSPESRAWAASIGELAARPSTFVKISGLALETSPGPIEPQARPFIEAALEAFGVERAMAGSDFPVSSVLPDSPGYDGWFDFVGSFGASPAETARLLGGTAEAVYLSR